MSGLPVRALFYDGRTSGARPVTLTLSGGFGAGWLTIAGADFMQEIALATLRIDERVGDTPRFLHALEGASIEIVDNDAFDAALAAAGISTLEQPVRRLEGRWHYAVLAMISIAIGTWAFLTYGVPALASRATALIPPTVDAQIGAEGLALLDRATFRRSTLAPARQGELRRMFTAVAAGAARDSSRYRLELREGGAIGANALALPSGIVVLTDELERAVRHDDELRAVFAHEVGHLIHRHSMQRLVQSSAIALLMLGLFGDVSGASSLVVAVPSVLIDAAYSRDLEREADELACRWMAQHGVAPDRLADLLKRLVATEGGAEIEYLSSHPQLAERECRRDSGSG